MLVYSDGGAGASESCISMTVRSLKKVIGQLQHPSSSSGRTNGHDGAAANVAVETTTADEVKSGNLSEHCCLLVMPGGKDLPYVERLAGKGNESISHFVRNGGGYLGICAGAYYGCSAVQFAQGDPLLEVVGPRELSFFNGISQGPVFAGFDYTSQRGAAAADIQLTPAGMEMLGSYVGTVTTTRSKDDDVAAGGETPIINDSPVVKIYYNGGCHFVDDSRKFNGDALRDFKSLTTPPMTSSPNHKFKVLATYAAPRKYLSSFVTTEGGASQRPLSALVASRYGRGRVVLSGVHFEASSELLKLHYDDDPYIDSLLPHIASSDAAREALLSACVKYLLDSDE